METDNNKPQVETTPDVEVRVPEITIDDAHEVQLSRQGESEIAEEVEITPAPTHAVLDKVMDPRMAATKDISNAASLSLTPMSLERLSHISYSNADFTMDQAGKEWALKVQEALGNTSDISFIKSAERAGADWNQRPEHEGEGMVAGKPRVNAGGSGERISGERAIMRVTSLMGLGDRIEIPLWHTGIWVTIRTPSDGALLELDRLIAMEKVTLGRQTNGLVFSHSSVYIMNHIMNLFEDCLYSHSVRDVTPKGLRSVIKSTDIPSICWGLMLAIYPKGYPYSHPCMANPDACQHVSKALLSIAKLLWVDNDKLTDAQRAFMVSRNKPRTVAEVEAYQSKGTQFNPREVVLNDAVSMWLKVPTIEEYVESGYQWVAGIVQMTEGTFATKLRGAERNKYISDQGALSAMNQYCHWVSKIVIQGGEIIDDENTVRDILKGMSADEDLTNTFFEAIGDYIETVTVAIVAIDNFDCPECSADQGKESPYKYLIPLDTMQTFFTLQAQRLSWALPRA